MIRFVRLLVAALMFTFAQTAYAQAPTWVVSEAAGKVVVRDAAGDHPAKRGMVVPVGGTLSTGPGARAVMVHGKDFATVSANSRVRVPNAQQTQGGRFALLQEFGNVVFQIEKLPQPHFGVRTPYLAAVVKGTTFSITVTEEGASLQVLEGAVQTSTLDDGASEIIRPGILATVNASDRFRLNVQGQDSRAIDSPARGQAPAAGAPAPEQATPNSDSTASNTQGSEVIIEAIAATPTDLGKATDGLVGGTTQIASVEVAQTRTTSSAGSGSESGKGAASSGKSAEDSADKGKGKDESADKGKGKDESADKGKDKDESADKGKDKDQPDDKGKGKDQPADKGKDQPDDKGKDKDQPADKGKDQPDDKGKDKDQPADKGKDQPDDKGKDKDQPADKGKDQPDDKGKDNDQPADKGKDKDQPADKGKDKPEPGTKGKD